MAERLLERFVQALAAVGLLCLTLIALVIVVDVILRWLISAPIEGLSEVNSLVAAVTIASFFPLSLLNDGHAKITFLGKALGPAGQRILDAFAALVTLAFFAVLSWQMARYTAELGRSGERTWVLQLDPAPWWWAATGLLAVAVIAQAGVVAMRLAGRVSGGEPAPEL